MPGQFFSGPTHGSIGEDLRAFSYTAAYNLTGWPAAVIRGGTSARGLPIGLQIVAGPWREDVVLAVAEHLEGAIGCDTYSKRK